jgi:hypothetical protein
VSLEHKQKKFVFVLFSVFCLLSFPNFKKFLVTSQNFVKHKAFESDGSKNQDLINYQKYLEAFRHIKKTTSSDVMLYVSQNEDKFWEIFVTSAARCDKGVFIPVLISERAMLFSVDLKHDQCREVYYGVNYVTSNYKDLDEENPRRDLCREVKKNNKKDYVSVQWDSKKNGVSILENHCT